MCSIIFLNRFANLNKGRVCVTPIGESLRMRLVPGSPHANIMPRTSNIYKIEGNKGFLAVFQGKSSLKWRIYAGTPKKTFEFCELCDFS